MYSPYLLRTILGIAGIVAGLAEVEGCDIKQKNSTRYTPLGWAAENGHEEAVRILLGRDDIDPDKPDQYGRTRSSRLLTKGTREC